MRTGHKLVLDRFCEVYDLLREYSWAEFWDLSQHEIMAGAVYVVGRQQFQQHTALIRRLIETGQVRVILSNPHEGSDTLRQNVMIYGVRDLIEQKKLLLLGGGDMDDSWPCLRYDSFLPKLLDYQENLEAALRSDEIYAKTSKPYKFLFLNGRGRRHRRYLLNAWQQSGLLAESLWSNLDGAVAPVQLLPAQYEVPRYQAQVAATGDQGYVKFQLFNDEWGEIYLNPAAYIDTYFSMVTETVHDYAYSFRTEKIWKPIVMGHPWIVSANRGFLRDMQELGFQTFHGILDETYDDIEDNDERLQRVRDLVEDLCRQDLADFLRACEKICKYNQQHHRQCRLQVRSEFPDRFFNFLSAHD